MFDDTPLVLVDDDEGLERVVQALGDAPVIGIDTESDSFYSYREKVCLIQLSDSTTDYIIDPLTINDMSPLAAILEDPAVVKILHGADYDIVCLKRDYNYQLHNVFDTLIASQLLGFKRIGLADLIGGFFGWEIDKKYQRHDWARRPLQNEHIEYARGDTHFLLALREILGIKLEAAGRTRHMVEECELVEKREWQGRRFDPDGYLGIKQVRSLDQDGLRVLRRLWLYRDGEAEKLDRPVFKVMPDAVLMDVAHGKPDDARALDKLMPGKTAMKRRHGSGLIAAVRDGLEDDIQIQIPKKKSKKPRVGPKPRLRGRQAERALGELKAWRNNLVASKADLNPFTVASNGVLQAIASVRPHDLEELEAVPQVRKWQVIDFGTEILAVLDRVDPQG